MKQPSQPSDYPSAWFPQPFRNHQTRVEFLATTPWIEALISVVLGLVFLILQRRELAEITWVVGVALSFTRYALTKKFEEELSPVHRLASVVDLQRQVTLSQFQEMIRVYLEITEPEFRQVKDTIITETNEKLMKLAQQKTSDQLATGAYYNWLLPMLESTSPGSRIWAISMMLEVEWDESPAEQIFIKDNLAAAHRGVSVERIFVVRRSDVAKLPSIKAIKAQLDAAGKFMNPLVVEREYLETHDPQLLKQLGDGLFAIDMRVALVDVLSPEGIRGYVTMNQGEIARLRRMFENLRIHARPLADAIQVAQRGTQQTATN